MKINKLLTVALAALAVTAGVAFAEDADSASKLNFSVSVDAAYMFPQTRVAGTGNSFSPITGAFGGAGGRVVGAMSYNIPTPLGENWLLNSANLNLKAKAELSPVTFKPTVEAAWTPLPFLVFTLGGEIGSGWSIPGVAQGIAYYSGDGVYTNYTPFATYYYNAYAQGVFQFDTGAIIPGDWTHVVMMTTYQVSYKGLINGQNQGVWMWQAGGNQVTGFQYYANAILAYQLPIKVLYRVGGMAEFTGHYGVEGSYAKFMTVKLSPIAQLTFTEKDSMNVGFEFVSRPRYASEDLKALEAGSKTEYELTVTGREWYFNQIGLSYTHNF